MIDRNFFKWITNVIDRCIWIKWKLWKCKCRKHCINSVQKIEFSEKWQIFTTLFQAKGLKSQIKSDFYQPNQDFINSFYSVLSIVIFVFHIETFKQSRCDQDISRVQFLSLPLDQVILTIYFLCPNIRILRFYVLLFCYRFVGFEWFLQMIRCVRLKKKTYQTWIKSNDFYNIMEIYQSTPFSFVWEFLILNAIRRKILN